MNAMGCLLNPETFILIILILKKFVRCPWQKATSKTNLPRKSWLLYNLRLLSVLRADEPDVLPWAAPCRGPITIKGWYILFNHNMILSIIISSN